MSGQELLTHAATASLGIMIVAMLLTILRLIRGPTLADRILALDLLTTLAIGFIAAMAIRSGFALYIDIAIAIGLLGFLSTVALARFLLRQAEKVDSGGNSQ